MFLLLCFFFFFKQKTAYEIMPSLVGSEMCIRDRYYDVLKQLWEELGSQLSSAHATLTVLPRQTEAGNPDMRVWSGQQHVTGYIEAVCRQRSEIDQCSCD